MSCVTKSKTIRIVRVIEGRPVVPDVSIWKQVALWLAGIGGTLAMLIGVGAKVWIKDRFHKVDKRIEGAEKDIDENRADIKKLNERTAEHAALFARLDESNKNAEKSRQKMDQKLDRLLELHISGANNP